MNKRLPQPGQRYQHLKHKFCQIASLASDSETGEKLVVFQTLHDDFGVYVQPLSLFLEEAEREEYSDTDSTSHFRRKVVRRSPKSFEPTSIQKSEPDTTVEAASEPLADGIHPKLMAFLDTDTDSERYAILREMEDIVDDHMIDTMAIVLDIVIEEGPIEVRYQELRSCLRTRMRYETNRLR